MNGTSQRPPDAGPARAGYGYGLPSEHVRNIAVDIILTLLTLYLFNLWVQHKQMLAVNAMLRQNKYSFWTWLLLSVITCGIYHVYHEFRKSEDIVRVLGRPSANDGLIALLLTIIGFGLISDAIQQARINEYFGSTAL
jgi:hypothetical protein